MPPATSLTAYGQCAANSLRPNYGYRHPDILLLRWELQFLLHKRCCRVIRMNVRRSILATATAVLFLTTQVSASDWPQFRGPDGNGVATGNGYPQTWGTEENIKWKIDLPYRGAGSPIVSGDHVFLSSATQDGQKRSLLCFDRANGKQLWERTVAFGTDETHPQNPFGSSTPATDGTRVVVWHNSAGLYCYDLSGKKLWSRDLGEFKHIHGYGSSPTIHEGRVILKCGPGKRVFVTAIDVVAGETLWETDEPYTGEKSPDDVGSWSTPVLAKVGGNWQIICAQATRVTGYDPERGDLLWWCDGLSGSRTDWVCSSPIVGDGICFAMADSRGPSMVFKLGGAGDITASSRIWHEERNPSSIGTGIFVDGHIYRPNAKPGTLECLDARTGKVKWKERSKDHWASMILADGHLYALNQRGTTVVLKPDPETFQQVAINDLGGITNATPAFSDGQIFIRTEEFLYCIDQ